MDEATAQGTFLRQDNWPCRATTSSVKSSPQGAHVSICLRIAVSFFLLAAIVPALSAQTAHQPAPPAHKDVRDGSHDFDFIYGRWRMPNRRLVKRFADSHEWDNFVTCDEGMPLAGGIGDMDFWRTNYWPNFVGVTVRTYDPETGLWRIYWVDNRFSHGAIGPPVVGKFTGNVGVFEGKDTSDGKPVLVRFLWTVNPKGSKVVAKWQQAFSADDGKTWEINWENEFIHDDHCEPEPSKH